MRLRINKGLRAALLATTLLVSAFTLPHAQAVGVSDLETDLATTTIANIEDGTSGYELFETTSPSKNGDPYITKLLYNEATGEYTPVYYRVGLANLGSEGTTNGLTVFWWDDGGSYTILKNGVTGSGTKGEKYYSGRYNQTLNAKLTTANLRFDNGLARSFYGLAAKTTGTTASEINGGAIYASVDSSNKVYAYTHGIIGDFINNSALAGDGGAIYFSGKELGYFEIPIVKGNFFGNRALNKGGAIYHSATIEPLNVQGDFIRNRGGSGGAVYMSGSVTGDFIQNHATSYGGAAYGNDKTTLEINGDFYFNSSDISGGALYGGNYTRFNVSGDFIGNRASASGGAIHLALGSTASFIALDRNVNLTGNFVGGSYSTDSRVFTAIELRGGSADLNAYGDYRVTVNDGIIGVDHIDEDLTVYTTALHINSGRKNIGSSYSNINAGGAAFGTVELNSNITNIDDITVYAGTLKLGTFSGTTLSAPDGSSTFTVDATHALLADSKLTINSEAFLVTNASYLGNSNTIVNNGTTTFVDSGTLNNAITNNGHIVVEGSVIADANLITGSGTGQIDGTLTFTDGTIAHEWTGNGQLIVETGSTVSSSAGYLKMGSTTINGQLNLTTGTLGVKLTGNGKTYSSGTLSTNADYLNTKEVILDGRTTLTGGTLDLYGDASSTLFEVNSLLYIEGDVTVNEKMTGTGHLQIYSNSSLTIDADYLDFSGQFINNGTLYLTTGMLEKTMTGTGSLIVEVDNTVTTDIGNINSNGDNTTNGTLILTGEGVLKRSNSGTGTLKIEELSKVTANADFLKVNTMNVEGTLQLIGGTLGKKVSGTGEVSIGETYTVTSSADYLAVDETSVDGTLNLTSGTLESTLTGAGTVNILEDQTVTGAAGNFGVKETAIAGALHLNSGTLGSTLTGAGSVKILATQTVISDVQYMQTEDSDPDDDVSTGSIQVEGTLILNGSGTLNSSYWDSGTLQFAADSDISSSANYLGVTNMHVDGTLSLTGGDLERSLSGEGTLKVVDGATVTVSKNSYYSAPHIDVNSTVIETDGTLVMETGSITTNDDFTLNGTLNTQGSIKITGTMKGDGAINVKSGTLTMGMENLEGKDITNNGTLKLSGETTLTQKIEGSGTLTVESGSVLTAEAGFYGSANSISNSGTLQLTTGTLEKSISGSNSKTYILEGETVTVNYDYLNNSSSTNNFYVEGTLSLTGTGKLTNELYKSTRETGGNGTVHIGTDSKITADSYYLQTNTDIDGELILETVNNGTINTLYTGDGTLTVSASGGGLTVSADLLKMHTLNNNNDITLTSGVLDIQSITGTGSLEIYSGNKVTMNADLLNRDNTLTNNGTLRLSGGTLNKNVLGNRYLETISGATVSTQTSFLHNYSTVTSNGTLLVTGGSIDKDISGNGTVAIGSSTTLSSTITTNFFSSTIDADNLAKLHVTSTGGFIKYDDKNKIVDQLDAYKLILNGDLSLADGFLTWDEGANMIDRETLQTSFQFIHNGNYNPFINIIEGERSYSLSAYEIDVYDPTAGYYLDPKANGGSSNKFVVTDYTYDANANTSTAVESYVKFSGGMGDDYNQVPTEGAKPSAMSFVWDTDNEGNVFLDRRVTHADGADIYAYSRDNTAVTFPDFLDFTNLEVERSFIGLIDGERAFFFGAEYKTIKLVKGDFIGNEQSMTDASYGGAMVLSFNTTITNVEGDFVGNRTHRQGDFTSFDTRGGAIYMDQSAVIKNLKGNFIGNGSYAYSTNVKTSNTHNSNAHDASGGAIQLQDSSRIDTITGDFVGNYAVSRNDDVAFEYYYAKGGGMYLEVNSEIGTITGNFIDNYASAGHFAYGGAIFMLSGSSIDSISGNFRGNSVTTKVTGYEDIHGGGIFEVKLAKGGAISLSNASIKNIAANFVSNTASSHMSAYGGAISIDDVRGLVAGSANTDTEIDKNRDITITGDFHSNAVIADGDARGGALYYIDNNVRDFSGIDSTFEIFDTMQYQGGVTISGDFVGNSASGTSIAEGGAIYNRGGEINILAEARSVLFEGNYTTTDGGKTKTYNAIENTALNEVYVGASQSIINFEASGDNVIVINDSITGSSTEGERLPRRDQQILNINLKANTETPTAAESTADGENPDAASGSSGSGSSAVVYSRVEFNNKVSDQTINVYGGELLLGDDGRNTTRTLTPSSFLKRVNLTVYNTATVQAERADSLGDGDNNILVTENGYMNLQAGKLSNDITVDNVGVLHIQAGVTIDSVLTIKDSGTLKGALDEDARLQHVTLGVNSEINGQAIAMENGTIEFTSAGETTRATVDGNSYDYITVNAKADINSIDGGLTLNVHPISEDDVLAGFGALLLKDYGDISTAVFSEGFNIEETVTININGRTIAVNSVHDHDGGILFALVPEPSSVTLSLVALAGLLGRRRRTRA